MALIKIASVSELPAGHVTEVNIAGNSYALCNANGELHCIWGTCPHSGGPLGQGSLHGYSLVCPWHAWEFDCRNGANDFDEDLKVPTFPVTIRDGGIYVDVPEEK